MQAEIHIHTKTATSFLATAKIYVYICDETRMFKNNFFDLDLQGK